MMAPRSGSRSAYHHGDLPRALLEAALTLIQQDGAEAFSLRSAAGRAGVNPAAVYRHYADRGALLRAVAAHGFERLATSMADRRQRATTDPGERFAALGAAYVGFSVENPELFRVMFGPHGAGGPDAPVRRRRTEGTGGPSAYDLLLEALEALDAAGRLVLPLDTAAVVAWSSVHGLAQLLVEGVVEPVTPLEATIAALTRSTLRGLAA